MSVSNSSRQPVRALLRRGAALALAALVLNLVVLVAGRALGASFTVPVADASAPRPIAVTAVVLATVLSLALGLGVAALASARFGSRAVRVLQIVGGVLAVLSVISPLVADVDPTTKIALTLMHLVTGAAYVIALAPFTRPSAPARASGFLGRSS